MTAPALTADQEDALREVVNIGMGLAGSSLGTTLDALISLSVPRVKIVDAAGAAAWMTTMMGDTEEVTAVRQSFYQHLRGEAMVLFGQGGCRDLADLLGHEQEPDEATEQELLLDVSNILVGAILNGLGEQLGGEFAFSAPEIMALHGRVADLLKPERLYWSHALLVEVNFSLEVRGFRCHLVLLMPESSIEILRDSVDRLLASL